MSPYRRNILVGVCVIGALVILGWMILQFGEAPARLFTKPSMVVHFKTDRADGLSEGSVITYRGVNVGHITKVTLTDDKLSVIVDGKVETTPQLPANIEGVIRSQGLIGGGSQMVLVPQRLQPPQGTLASGATVPARFVGLDVLPPEFARPHGHTGSEGGANSRFLRQAYCRPQAARGSESRDVKHSRGDRQRLEDRQTV
jgi:hypothetical protein